MSDTARERIARAINEKPTTVVADDIIAALGIPAEKLDALIRGEAVIDRQAERIAELEEHKLEAAQLIAALNGGDEMQNIVFLLPKAEAHVADLERNADEAGRRETTLRDTLARMSARLAEAERLLKPFADYASAFDAHAGQMVFGVGDAGDAMAATIMDLYAARDFLNRNQEPPKEPSDERSI